MSCFGRSFLRLKKAWLENVTLQKCREVECFIRFPVCRKRFEKSRENHRPETYRIYVMLCIYPHLPTCELKREEQNDGDQIPAL